jgi:hypothetical protein
VIVVLRYADGEVRVIDHPCHPGAFIATDPVISEGEVSMTYFDPVGYEECNSERAVVYAERAPC